jgi:hypothetical protein
MSQFHTHHPPFTRIPRYTVRLSPCSCCRFSTTSFRSAFQHTTLTSQNRPRSGDMELMLTTMTPFNPSKKRKRQRVGMNDDKDDEAHIRLPRAMAAVDQPPTFSTSSPSSLPPPPAPVIRGGFRKKKHVKGKQDTDDAPPPEGLDSDPPKEKIPKPKKKPSVRPKPGDAGQSSSVSASTS